MQRSFSTPTPPTLLVTIGSGSVRIDAADVESTDIEVTGADSDDATVVQRGDEVHVAAPSRRGGLFGGRDRLGVRVTMPVGSAVVTKLGSADLSASGELGEISLRTGSGAVRVEAVRGDARAQSGSGEIDLGRVTGAATVSTGSGDIRLGSVGGEVSARSGSGELRLAEAHTHVALRTGSGNIGVGRTQRGQLVISTGSGDVRVGIPGGTPVWTDVTSSSGRVHSDLAPVGAPSEDQDYLELRARTGSGDVYLERL
jgi:hypothetical protein